MRHTVVISDVHLSEVEPGTGAWMRYRQRPFLPDAEIATMLEAVRREVRRDGGSLTVVLGGDVFDLDAPRVIDGESVPHDLPRTAEHAAPAITAILDDHPIFVGALAAVVAEGHALVVLSGNHDVHLTLPEVRAIVISRVARSAEERARVAFRAWFHLDPDGILVEHGHQYDARCSLRSPMAPFLSGGEIEPSLGSLVARHIVARLGTLNPHDERSFMLGTLGGIRHWARHYLFTRRSIAAIWASGVVNVLLALPRRPETSEREGRAKRRADLRAAARETGAPLYAVARHARLGRAPMGDDTARVLREMFVDRVVIAAAAALAAGIALASPRARWASILAPLGAIGWARVSPREPIREGWRRAGGLARRVAAIHAARAVVFGHTHEEAGSFDPEGVFIGNSGSWPAVAPGEDAPPRPVVWLRSDGPDAPLEGGLYAWIRGDLVPVVARGAPRDQSRGTARVSTTPGIEATNASRKNDLNPTRSAR